MFDLRNAYHQKQDPKEAWHYNHVTFTPITKNLMLYCRSLNHMLSMLHVRLTIKVKVGIPESFKVEWYPHKITGSSHLKGGDSTKTCNAQFLNPAFCLFICLFFLKCSWKNSGFIGH